MKVTGRFEFLSSKERDSRSGNKLYIVSLLQGDDDMTKIYVDYDKHCRLKDIPKMTDVEVTLDVRESKDRTYIDLLDHKILGAK